MYTHVYVFVIHVYIKGYNRAGGRFTFWVQNCSNTHLLVWRSLPDSNLYGRFP